MSLFENDHYQWRETYFVFFDEKNRPSAEKLQWMLEGLGQRCSVTDIQNDDEGRFESLTLFSPDDYAAMDISYVSGQEVSDHAVDMAMQMKETAQDEQEREEIAKLPRYSARLDVYHFEQLILTGGRRVDVNDEEDGLLDPGAVLIAMEKLVKLCKGIGVDPQSNSFM